MRDPRRSQFQRLSRLRSGCAVFDQVAVRVTARQEQRGDRKGTRSYAQQLFPPRRVTWRGVFAAQLPPPLLSRTRNDIVRNVVGFRHLVLARNECLVHKPPDRVEDAVQSLRIANHTAIPLPPTKKLSWAIGSGALAAAFRLDRSAMIQAPLTMMLTTIPRFLTPFAGQLVGRLGRLRIPKAVTERIPLVRPEPVGHLQLALA